MFNQNEKKFYAQLDNTGMKYYNIPTKEQITNFLQSIWSNPVNHNPNTNWITDLEERHSHIETQNNNIIILTEKVQSVIKKLHNWKSPGPDGIQNYWLKAFTVLHNKLAGLITYIIQNPSELPTFLTRGITFIKPKNNDTLNPANYRPITCLPTLYKIITSIIMQLIQERLDTYQILTEEQKGCRKHSQGCKEQLIIDSVIHQQALQNNRNLFITYIDYKKAFDKVPHSWLLHVLEIYKIGPTIIHFLKNAMQN